VSDRVNIVLRLTRQKGGKWRLGIRASSTLERTSYTLTGSVTIKRLPAGLFAAGHLLENRMLPSLAEMSHPQNAGDESRTASAKKDGCNGLKA
jgi:hypothetical protein